MDRSSSTVRWPRYANLAGLPALGSFVALMAVPEWASSLLQSMLQVSILLGSVVAAVMVLVWTRWATDANRAVAQVVVTFAAGVVGAALYLRSISDEPAVIPIAGGLVFMISLVGLALTCFVVRNER